MFKRITKRQEKQAQDEELGLDEDTKQMFGIQDTDSDETETSDSGSDEENDSEAEEGLGGLKTEWLDAGVSDSGDEDEEDTERAEFDDMVPISLSEAVKNPLYVTHPGVNECIVCPNKKLKNDKMVETHLQSAAHTRRFRRFCELANAQEGIIKDARRIVALITQEGKPATASDCASMSKRALKRKQKQELIKKKRETIKQIVSRKRSRKEKGEKSTLYRDPKKPKVSETLSSNLLDSKKKIGSTDPTGKNRVGPRSDRILKKRAKGVDTEKVNEIKNEAHGGLNSEKRTKRLSKS